MQIVWQIFEDAGEVGKQALIILPLAALVDLVQKCAGRAS